jgi:hypothetical protein
MKQVHSSKMAGLGARCLFLALLGGCTSSAEYALAPVSGVVTLDGKPVPYTQVVFVPQGAPGNANPGPGSAAACDDQGRFQLKTVRGDDGAVVGTHSVRISSLGPPPKTVGDTTVGSPPKEAFPAQYNVNSTLTFEVPAEGTTAADFKLTTAP